MSERTRLVEVLETLSRDGFALVRGAPAEMPGHLASSLGFVIHREHIRARDEARSLVCSRRALSPHTDHHAARHILWRCLEPAREGGVSVLVDGLAVVDALPAGTRERLTSLRLAEHNVFEGDLDRHPMLWTDSNGQRRLYYSFWLARRSSEEDQRLVRSFERALSRAPHTRIRLRAGDVLVVDNGRVLHGRTAIGQGCRRHLIRDWLAPTPLSRRDPRSPGR